MLFGLTDQKTILYQTIFSGTIPIPCLYGNVLRLISPKIFFSTMNTAYISGKMYLAAT